MSQTPRKNLRSSRQKNHDIVIALLCYFVINKIGTVRLYSVNKIFSGFIRKYEEMSSERLEFYRDVVTHVYKELIGIFEDIMYSNFIRPIPGHEDIHFSIIITPSMAHCLLSGIPEATLIKEIFPHFLDAYKNSKWGGDEDEEES